MIYYYVLFLGLVDSSGKQSSCDRFMFPQRGPKVTHHHISDTGIYYLILNNGVGHVSVI